MSQQPNTQIRWTPELVEQKLFLSFNKGQDVSNSLPAMPQWNGGGSTGNTNNSSGIFELPDSANLLFKYVENGPVATGGANGGGGGVRTNNNSNATTPKKGPGVGMLSAMGTPTSKGALKPGQQQQQQAPGRTPKGANGGAPGPRTPKSKSDAGSKTGGAGGANTIEDKENSCASSPTAANGKNGGKMAPIPKLVSGGSMAPPIKIKWPGHVPTNAELKGDSRSKLTKYTIARVQGQDGVDPDLIFGVPDGEFPLTAIFANNPQGLAKAKAPRGNSGDWENDNFTEKEEAKYKAEMKFVHLGPSQAKGLFHRSLV